MWHQTRRTAPNINSNWAALFEQHAEVQVCNLTTVGTSLLICSSLETKMGGGGFKWQGVTSNLDLVCLMIAELHDTLMHREPHI